MNNEKLFIHGISEAILKMLAPEMTQMADKCGYNKYSSYFNGYLETTSNVMNITKQIVLIQVYIS